MPTDKVGLSSVEELMTGYQPIYQPIYPLLLGKSQAYSEDVGTATKRTITTIGDVRTKHVTPKDNILKQINASSTTKAFKKYFLMNQFQISHLQAQDGVEDVVTQVLDEHHIQFDELVLLGEGTSNSTMVNNGLFWSNDANYQLETSTEIAKDTDGGYLIDFVSKVAANATVADRSAGRKLLIFYGSTLLPQVNSLFPNGARSFKSAVSEILGNNYSVTQLPSQISPAGANGWIMVNLDQVKLHYSTLPKVLARGSNEEQLYYWINFIMGSAMLEVLSPGAVVRQPATLAA